MSQFQISAIGNAIVDVISFVDEVFLTKHNLPKGSMSLIDTTKALELSQNIKIEKICAGGSAANTIYLIAQQQLKTAFLGKIGNDEYGNIFHNSLKQQNITFAKLDNQQIQTARSFILVTPDGQRTMATFLGDAGNIQSQINPEIIKNSQIFYIEGYLWDLPSSIKYLKEAINIAKQNNIKIAFTLSDLFCVSRHKADFLEIFTLADIVFANKAEATALFADGQFLQQAINKNTTFIVTKDKDGVEIHDNKSQKSLTIKAQNVTKLIDSTGAGDAFAAGFLHGICTGKNLTQSGEAGNALAMKIIQIIGAK